MFYGIATIIIGVFPCDKGCSLDIDNPSISQLIHSLAGLLTYVFVPISLLLIGIGFMKFKVYKKHSVFTLGCGIISLLFVIVFMNNTESNFIGIYQRIIEAIFMVWVVFISFQVKNLIHES